MRIRQKELTGYKMAKVGDLKRLNKEDFAAKDRDMIDRLGYILNPFMEKVVGAFNKGIDFNNLNQELVTFAVKVDSSGVPQSKASLKYNLKTRLNGMMVIAATNNTDSVTVTSTPFITFTQEGTSINISNISGLPADKSFSITVILIG